jgi:drug/metabolite transporter (DMT)-like permease
MNALELGTLAAIWGASFLLMRVGAQDFGPIPLMALRVSIAALLLIPVLRSLDARKQFRDHLVPLFIVGVTNSALPFCLLAYAALYVTAGVDSILNATTPFWAAIVAFAWLRTPMTRIQISGLVIGFLGVVALGWDAIGHGQPGTIGAVCAALLATLSYGFAVNYSKRSLVGVKPFVSAFGSQLFASLVLLPLAIHYWPTHSLPPIAWYSVVGLGAICTALAYVLFFRLVAHAGAAYAASVTFLIPVFGVLWGALFLKERVSPFTFLGCAIVLLGVALASGKIKSIRTYRTERARHS